MEKRKAAERGASKGSPHPKRAAASSSSLAAKNFDPFEKFGREFFKTMGQRDGNYIASPLSCQFALGLVLAGAKKDTLAAMAKVLHLSKNVKASAASYRAAAKCLQDVGKEVELTMANKAYISQQLVVKVGYLTLLKNSFEASAEKVNFSDKNVVRQINGWVKEATQGKITDLIDSVDPDSAFVLVNAICFKGKWAKPFLPEDTSQRKFFSGQQEIKVPMMYNLDLFEHAHLEDCAAQVLVLPYKGGKINMVLVLPDDKIGLQALEEKILEKDLSQLVARATKKRVHVILPKFKVETTIDDLEEYLEKMGLGIIFGEEPNLTGITETDPLQVDRVIQKAMIEVNEEGTVAAAATATFVGKGAAPKPAEMFKCDHPFLFFVTYKNDFCLFGGRVINPLE